MKLTARIVLIAVMALCAGAVKANSGNATTAKAAGSNDIDTVRMRSVSLGTNLIYLASSTPNLHVWAPIGDHFTAGLIGGLKAWPRWLPWDNDPKVDKKWRHFAIVPTVRYWPKANYHGFFMGADLLWTHYNVGGVTFPFGMYPEVKENRLQGDFIGIGPNLGWSWKLTDNLRVEVEAGFAAGYNTAEKYQCTWCGANLGKTSGPAIVPKLGLNLAYNFFKRKAEPEDIGIIAPPPPVDTLKRPEPVDPPVIFAPEIPEVEDWKGVAGLMEKDHPVLRPSSEYQPYTPDRILRKEESPLYVFFQLDKFKLLREFDEPTARGHNAHRDNGPVLDEIMDITSKILADTTSSVTKIQIIGLASVEGTVKHNRDLANARALALQRYIQDRLPIPDDMFDTVGGGEAWSEFRDEINDLLLEGGGQGLSEAQLRSVLEIIDNEPNLDKREYKLKRLEGGKLYKTLLEYVLGDQRNSGYLRIYYDYVPDESAREINEGIKLLEQKDYEGALKALEAKRDDSRSLNVYAVALFYNGREAEALQILREASETDPTALRNLQQLEEIARQRAAYEKYLSDMETYARQKYTSGQNSDAR